jgi:hypothetical protein
MAKLYGRPWTRGELLSHTGDLSQVGGIRIFCLEEGSERGVRTAEIDTGLLRLTVYLDRGMDIGPAHYKNIPLGWISPTGTVSPAYFDHNPKGWLSSFHGGLLTTCGLTQAGPPGEEDGELLGQHGNINHLPAWRVNHGLEWQGDDCCFWLEGQMRDVSVFGHDLLLTRRISANLGESHFVIADEVTNMGSAVAPYMILYHFNLGFPLIAAGTLIDTPSLEIIPRDEDAARGVKISNIADEPQRGYREQVFFHRLKADEYGVVKARAVNRNLGLALTITFKQQELSEFTQWKMMGEKTYVMGLEPGNCRPEGRPAARRRGALSELAPGESRSNRLEVSLDEIA